MLICSVFTAVDGRSKLVILPEIGDGNDRVEISLTEEQALEIKALRLTYDSEE